MYISEMSMVVGKFANMRKEQKFVVYPAVDGLRYIKVQSDKSIGMFDPETGVGMLNTKAKYFVDLAPQRGAIKFTFPKEFVEACKLIQCPVGEPMVIG